MKRDFYTAGSCFITLWVLFFAFDPNKLPSFILILPFILIFGLIVSLTAFLLQKRGLARRRSLKIAVLCAVIPTLLLVLQSIGQLTVRDVLTLGVLFVLSFFYITRSTQSA
jgi:hypothetical protein